MFIVTAKVEAWEEDFPGSRVKWVVGQSREVHDSLVDKFRNNPAAWTVSGGSDSSPMQVTKTVTGVISYSAGENTTYPVQNFTFATLPAAASYTGMQARVTDLNNALFESNGTRWKPVNGVAVIASLDTDFSMTGVTETIAFKKLLPAGLLKNGDRLRIRSTFGKSSTVETTTFALRLGSLGTTADTSLQSFSAMATTTVAVGLLDDFKRLSATTVRKLGNGSQLTQYAGGGTAPIAFPVTVSNMDSTALYLSATLTQSSTAETATMYDFVLELVSSGS